MKKLFVASALALLLSLSVFPAFAEAEKLPDFTDDFESYEVTGEYIEEDETLTRKWDNNVFRGGEALGMDAHIVNVGKIEYENGSSGNRVLHLENMTGADTFFYMGPGGDYRVKNFTAEFRIKFLTEGVPERSWAGISFRKRANSHYTGTNNLMFVIQRYVESNQIAGHGFAIFNGGSANDLDMMGDLYGEKLSLTKAAYTVPGGKAGEDLPWVNYKLVAEGNRYRIYADDTLVLDCTFDIPSYDYFGYLSLNCCTSNILVDDFRITVQDETLPPEILPLPAPVVRLNAEEKEIEWDAVEGASTYLVDLGVGEPVSTFARKYSLANLASGTYEITVTAVSDDVFEAKNSAPSEAVTYVAEKQNNEEGDNDAAGCGSSVIAGGPAGAALAACAAWLFGRRKRG